MRLPLIRSADELAALVNEIGFLPFFKGTVNGFSLEECTPPDFWFAEGVDGPWEWKGPAIQSAGCAYGKFFKGKSGYISHAWFPDFANLRRDGMTFSERYDAGLLSHNAKTIYNTLLASDSLLSRDLKGRSGCPQKAFDGVLTRLQMQAYVTVIDFEYQRDRFGRPYGWGLARVDTPERAFGEDFMDETGGASPLKSREKIMAHLSRLWPDAPEKQLARLIDP